MKTFQILSMATASFLTAYGVTAIADTELGIDVRYVNDFSAGYDASNHSYRQQWIRDVITDAKTRPIEFNGCISFYKVSVPQSSAVDGQPNCPDLSIGNVPPDGVSKIKWTLTTTDSLTAREIVVKTKTVQLERYRPHPGQSCFPRARDVPLVGSDSSCYFTSDLSTASRTNEVRTPRSYSVKIEGLTNANVVKAMGMRTVSVPKTIPLIVSIGESLASGEGNPDRNGAAKGNDCEVFTSVMMARDKKPEMHEQPKWLDKRDHRSLSSGAARAASSLLTEWPYIGFLTFAKSGSKLSSTEQPQDLLDQLAQVRSAVGAHKIDVLHMSIGGNDVGYAQTLKALITYTGLPTPGGLDVPPDFTALLNTLENDLYPQINEKISSLGLNIGKVVINEYPNSLFNNENNRPSEGCGVFQGPNVNPLGGPAVHPFFTIHSGDANRIYQSGIKLNEAVKRAADSNRWHLVTGIAKKFEGRGYCTSQSFWVSAEDSCDHQGDFEGVVHPNKEGTAAISHELAKAFRNFLPPPFPPSTPLTTQVTP